MTGVGFQVLGVGERCGQHEEDAGGNEGATNAEYTKRNRRYSAFMCLFPVAIAFFPRPSSAARLSNSALKRSGISHLSALPSLFALTASATHSFAPQRYAPLPGALPVGSIRTSPSDVLTILTRLFFSEEVLHETQVLIGVFRCPVTAALQRPLRPPLQPALRPYPAPVRVRPPPHPPPDVPPPPHRAPRSPRARPT